MPKKGQLDADEMRALKAKKEAAKKADVKARAAAAAKAEEKRQKEARQKAKAAEVAKKKADREKAKAAGAKLPSAGGPPAEALALQAQLMPVVKEAERLESHPRGTVEDAARCNGHTDILSYLELLRAVEPTKALCGESPHLTAAADSQHI